MYEELDSFERALQHFGTRVEFIAAMEMGRKISSEDAYQLIKSELKELKKVRKTVKKDWATINTIWRNSKYIITMLGLQHILNFYDSSLQI